MKQSDRKLVRATANNLQKIVIVKVFRSNPRRRPLYSRCVQKGQNLHIFETWIVLADTTNNQRDVERAVSRSTAVEKIRPKFEN